jgi:hypothetical protein
MFRYDNKAQGQSLKEVSIDLWEKCFFHICDLHIGLLAPTGKKTNVPHKDVLCWIFFIERTTLAFSRIINFNTFYIKHEQIVNMYKFLFKYILLSLQILIINFIKKLPLEYLIKFFFQFADE